MIHLEFDQIHAEVPRGALIVFNDTRVIPARIWGRKPTGGSVELLLLRRVGNHSGERRDEGARERSDDDGGEVWEALSRNLAGAPVGTTIGLAEGWTAELRRRGEAGLIRIYLRPPADRDESMLTWLDRVGEVPLPPYIEAARKRGDQSSPFAAAGAGAVADDDDARPPDRERYQTVYAKEPGAVAAPTAGLHFTESSLARLREAGHQLAFLTLHVGPGTFRPVKVDDVELHEMDAETYSIPPATAKAVEDARRSGRPVLAVGTTVVRALESAARAGEGMVRSGTSSSRLFLRPGSDFLVVTDLLTNFHLPRSTLLMLVAAFAGRDHVMAAYAEAIAAGYRFYSYGDAMLIRGTA